MDIKQIELLYGSMIKKFKEMLKDDENYKSIITKATTEEGKIIEDKYQIRIIEKNIYNENFDFWNYETLKQVSCPLDKETLNVILKLIKSDEK